jgi:hypothetical protein
MRKILTGLAALIFTLSLLSCGGKDTAKSVAEKWCKLNGKVAKAQTDEEKQKAKDVREEFEKEMDKKYATDSAFLRQVGEEVEKCEDASEGK